MKSRNNHSEEGVFSNPRVINVERTLDFKRAVLVESSQLRLNSRAITYFHLSTHFVSGYDRHLLNYEFASEL